ncbi:MAG: hypothetical protein Fur005_34140 [Roseiflexaceae bacterium]
MATTLQRLPRSTPAAQGIDPQAVQRFYHALDREIRHMHSVMLIRHGHVIAEGWWSPYQPADRHVLFSLSKSFTATAVGYAIGEGLFSLDDQVLGFFPAQAPAEPNDFLTAMRVRDLLSMTSGHGEDTLMSMFMQPEGDWIKGFLHQPVTHQPGSHFVYNSGATYMLSAIVQLKSGQTLLEYLEPRLFKPLGIRNPVWEVCPHGINVGGWGLSITTEDIACFGQCYIQGGIWQGRQVVAAEWVAAASAIQASNGSNPESDWEQGYGYQFWRCRHNAYRGDGAFGQFCVIIPEHDFIFAATASVEDMQAVLNILWREVLPGLHATPRPADAAADAALANQLSTLALPVVSGAATPLAGIAGRRYQFSPNEQQLQAISFAPQQDRIEISIHDDQGEHLLVAGVGSWAIGTTTFDARNPRLGGTKPPREEIPVGISAAWRSSNTLAIQIWYTLTPFSIILECQFGGSDAAQLTLTPHLHVSFGPKDLPAMTATAVER